MKKNKKAIQKNQALLSAIAIAACFVLGFLFAEYSKHGSKTYNIEGILWPSPPKLNEFFLIDENNLPFTLADLTGRWSIVFFGFANCPDICPSTLAAMSKAETELRSIREFGKSGKLIFVSVDPERDTPAVLKTYASHFSPSLKAVTGTPEELKILTKSVGAIFLKIDTGKNIYSVDHSAGLFFISPEKKLFSVLTPPIRDSDILDRFNKVIEAHRELVP